jgi:hypothetical protein
MSNIVAGFDLTDPFARQPRAIDVALLNVESRQVTFEQLMWNGFGYGGDANRQFMAAVYDRFSDAEVWVVDGPVALAMPELQRRDAEHELRAPGRTPWFLPEVGARPFAGYIRGSVLFHLSLFQSERVQFVGMAANVSDHPVSLLEAYPGAAWRVLAGGRLPSKATAAGTQARRQLLSDCGLLLQGAQRLTHDQLDAALCAYLGHLWTWNEQSVRFVGTPVSCDNARQLREGQIVQPCHIAPNWPKQDFLLKPQKPQSPRKTAQAIAPAVPRERPPAPHGLPQHDWVYFAGPGGAEAADTVELAAEENVIHRTVFAAREVPTRIPHVAELLPGQTLLLCYRSNRNYDAMMSCTIDEPDLPLEFQGRPFPAFESVPTGHGLGVRLTALQYKVDPQIGQHTVLCVDAIALPDPFEVLRPGGMQAIYRWADVFA